MHLPSMSPVNTRAMTIERKMRWNKRRGLRKTALADESYVYLETEGNKVREARRAEAT